MKIYTKTGDKGSTSLLGGTKLLKSDLRIEAYGTVDELNSYIGLCRDMINDGGSVKILLEVQDRLFIVGSLLATDPGKEIKMELPVLHESDIQILEKEIDRMDSLLPEMRNFILPGGHVTISQIHIARCVCRRAERCCVRIGSGSEVDDIILKYLNRLSDYLFILSRFIGDQLKVDEIPWHPRK